MSGDDTQAIKNNRSYKRLLLAIINDYPQTIIQQFLFECAACNYKHALLTEGNKEFEEHQEKILSEAEKEAKKYIIHYQSGREILVKKTTPLGKILLRKQELLLRQIKKSIDDADEPYTD